MTPFKTSERPRKTTKTSNAHSSAGGPDPDADVPIPPEIFDLVVSAYRGKTHHRTFPGALTVAARLEVEGLSAFLNLIDRASPHERGLIVSHVYKNYLHSPRLREWLKAANDDFFYAKARVANSGIKKTWRRNRTMAQARKVDRDTAGFNVQQESRDALSIVNGLFQARWTQSVGVGGRRNIICLAVSLAKLLAVQGGGHGLAACYREYTDLYGVRHSVVERDTGLVNILLVHPDATELTCEYIESGTFNSVEDLLLAVLHSSVVLKHQQLDGAQ